MNEFQPVTWYDDPSHFRRVTRREFLYVGLVGGIGLTLSDFFRLQAQEAAVQAKAKGVIHIYLPGGISAQESFDPKPLAPVEIRGPFGSIKTKLDGVYFNELLPNTAQIADRLTIIRSISHGEAAHERGTSEMFTGYKPSQAIQYPSMGSVVAHELGGVNDLPPYVCIPEQPNPYAGSGYLSNAFGPFGLGADPANTRFSVRDLTLSPEVDHQRFQERQNILAAVDAHFSKLEKSDSLDAMDAFYQHAYSLISSQSAREAFNLQSEPDAIKDDYGRNDAGMRMLMARRLVEGGVRFVSMVYGGWDHHQNIKAGIQRDLPKFDKAFAALIRDLDSRGMLDSTLVMVTTEFGRSPKINQNAGRDHWPRVFSVLLAGGGLKRGTVYGSSDATASEPDDNPLAVEDFAATIYHQLGIDPDKMLMSPGNRPVEIVRDGQVVQDLLA
ncbi:MAG: DUF1501 domain-containing protein [Chthoniobacteraceae bacterium]|jgi:hypothetical protein